MVRKSNEDMKLATILETHGRSPLFPKIGKGKHDKSKEHLDASRKKIKGLRSYFKRDHDTTANSREGSLTIDTRLETEEDHGV